MREVSCPRRHGRRRSRQSRRVRRPVATESTRAARTPTATRYERARRRRYNYGNATSSTSGQTDTRARTNGRCSSSRDSRLRFHRRFESKSRLRKGRLEPAASSRRRQARQVPAPGRAEPIANDGSRESWAWKRTPRRPKEVYLASARRASDVAGFNVRYYGARRERLHAVTAAG